MTLNKWLYTRLVLPTFERGRHAGLNWRLTEFDRREQLSLDENTDLQWAALRSVVRHAYDTTAFYRDRMEKASVSPDDIKSPVDLTFIPPLTRKDIRENLPALCSTNFAPTALLTSATGGTTDTPVQLKRDVDSVRTKTAAQVQFNAWAGMRPGDRVFHLWGARSDYAENPSWRWKLYDRGLMRNVWAPTSLINSAVLDTYIDQINAFRPHVIYAYPTPLTLFCDHLRRTGKKCYRPGTVICTAEALLPQDRAAMQETLGCEIFEHYGSREFGMIAAECEAHQNLHVNPLLSYVEFSRVEGGDKENLYEIFVTDLTNYGMPLIRYRVNDCVAALPPSQQCSCGRGYPFLGRISGRTSDVFILPDGSKVPGVALTNRVLQVCPGLSKIQVIQETIRDYRIRFVPGESFDNSAMQLLKENLRKFFPDELIWQFERVDDIEREASGKTRFCISRLASGAGSSAPAQLGRGTV